MITMSVAKRKSRSIPIDDINVFGMLVPILSDTTSTIKSSFRWTTRPEITIANNAAVSALAFIPSLAIIPSGKLMVVDINRIRKTRMIFKTLYCP